MPSSADGRRGWVALAVVLALGALLVFALPAAARVRLDWQPGTAWREPWRAATAALVHYSTLHLAANLAGTLVVAAFGQVARVPGRVAWAWLVAWPATQFGLLLRPDLLHYGGLSGVLHAGVACVATHLVLCAHGRRRAVGALVIAGLVVKVATESPWGAPLRHPAGWDIAVAPFAHASGLVAGLLATAVCEGVAHVRPRWPRAGADATS